MKSRIISYQDQDFARKISSIIQSNSAVKPETENAVKKIIADVKKNGDKVVIKLCNQFDKTSFKNGADLLVSKKEINSAIKNLDKEVIKALELSFQRVFEYHQKQLPKDFSYQDKIGNKLGNIWRPIEKIAIYVPGGTASYPSSVIMNAVPAIVAGCSEISMTTPSLKGKINEVVLAAAEICGIKTIYKTGGAAAIAALTYGTKTISKVDKIVGPGNSFVAIAKKQVFGEVGIDMIAGPTDILIIADNKNNPDWIAADLLSQLEHGPDSKAILVSDDLAFANLVNNSISKLAKTLPRVEIVKQSLKKSAFIIVKNLENDAAEIANKIAPEHLEIQVKNPDKILGKIKNAGAVFLGQYSPEAIGDYIAGPSHTLPTSGTARFSSGLSVFDFLRRMSVIDCSKDGFKKLQNQTELLAKAEGFDAHGLSIAIRQSSKLS
ncbi:MAG: histidinol dehydrogenase [Rickettsiaceae bacterium]|jgi:histidinol dehydrogenase|nr:histidinol dehydrogenase [Rickettsiaceae bacterium]